MAPEVRAWLVKFNALYDRIDRYWHAPRTSVAVSNVVLLVFVGAILITFFPALLPGRNHTSLFFAIGLAFNVLLVFEVLQLLFVFTRSVASSVGKQFEIISLILLRDSFKELGYLPMDMSSQRDMLTPLVPVLVDAIGAMIIFLLIGFFYRAQKHERITDTPEEQAGFVSMKKVVALVLFIAFVELGVQDVLHLFQSGVYQSSFSKFYTLLVITDIFILLFSLRYSTRYYNLFRYSSFALATVILRFSLSAPKYYNVLLGVSAGIFVLCVTYVYNYLTKEQLPRKPVDV
jgi:hypothetical protein